MAMDPTILTQKLKHEARRLGFDLAGVCPAVAPPGIDRFREWLEAGYAGKMTYLSDRAAAYEHPEHLLDGVRSIVMLAVNYKTSEPQESSPAAGRVSRYAWGSGDYHDLIRQRLHQLADFLRRQDPEATARGVVDTAPLLEREFAQLAGLGWIGKNTLLLNRGLGSWFFLAALLTSVRLDYDRPFEADHCGTCRACLDACPTNAFPQPYVLDAKRCISYLTIELRESIDPVLREGVGDWLFGCDVCQDVCPWNHHAPVSSEPVFQPESDMDPLDLGPLFYLDDDAFRRRYRHTALWRAKRRGILRNAATVLGNQKAHHVTDALVHGLSDSEPLVRVACAGALGRLASGPARRAVLDRQKIEEDDEVRQELSAALRETRDAEY